MDRGTDARNLLMNKGEVPLILGYVGIKNRSQADINEKKTVKQFIISGSTGYWGRENVLQQEPYLFITSTRMFRNYIISQQVDKGFNIKYLSVLALADLKIK